MNQQDADDATVYLVEDVDDFTDTVENLLTSSVANKRAEAVTLHVRVSHRTGLGSRYRRLSRNKPTPANIAIAGTKLRSAVGRLLTVFDSTPV